MRATSSPRPALSGLRASVLRLRSAAVILPRPFASETVSSQLSPDALWLLGFGLASAALACALATPSREGLSGSLFGAAMNLIGGARRLWRPQWRRTSHRVGDHELRWRRDAFREKLSLNVGRPVLVMLGLLESARQRVLLPFSFLVSRIKVSRSMVLPPRATNSHIRLDRCGRTAVDSLRR